MRIIDVACAASFAIMSTLVLISVDPGSISLQTQNLVADARAQRLIQDYTGSRGLPYFAASRLEVICTSAQSYGNQSARILVSVDGKACAGQALPNTPGGRYAETLDLDGRMVTIEAWVREKA